MKRSALFQSENPMIETILGICIFIGTETFGRFMGVLEQRTKVNIARLGR